MNTTANKLDTGKNVLIAGFVLFLALPYLDGCSDKLKSFVPTTLDATIPPVVDATIPPVVDATLPTLPAPNLLPTLPTPNLIPTLPTLPPAEGVLGSVRVDLSDVTAEQELFVRSDATQNAPVLTAQAELRQLRTEVAELNEKVLAIVTAVSSGTLSGGMSKARVEGIARNITAHYWNNHDAVASKRGYKSVIKWQDVNY